MKTNKILLLGIITIFFVLVVSSYITAYTWSSSLETNLDVWYDFDSDSGTTITDYQGNYTGTAANIEDGDWEEGVLENALHLNNYSSNEYINTTYNPSWTTSSNFSISFWMKAENEGTAGSPRMGSEGGSSDFLLQKNGVDANDWRWRVIDESPTTSNYNINADLSTGAFVHIVLVRDVIADKMRTYVNGVNIANATDNAGGTIDLSDYPLFLGGSNNGSSLFAGSNINITIDLFGIWSRVLTQAEVTALYNGGDGLSPTTSNTPIRVNLTTPTNNSVIASDGTNFNVNFTIAGSNPFNFTWVNSTYYVWFLNGTLLNKTTIDLLTKNQTNETLFIDNFELGNFVWNAYGCYGNATYTSCKWADNGNFTFIYRPFAINSQSYNSFIYETSYQTYIVNITTIPSILNVISRFIYNGSTTKIATTTCSGGECIATVSFDIPLTDSSGVNVSSYWNITVFDGTTSYSFDTEDSSIIQNITRIHLEVCNATYTSQALNFTAWEEQNLSRITKFYFAGTFHTWVGSGSVYRNQSFLNASTESMGLCVAPNMTQYVDAQIEYAWENSNSTYIPRNYYFDNASISNESQEIRLYLLPAEDSTTFILKTQDQKLSPVTNALIYIQRYYPQDGTFRTVQIAKTDSNGETVGFYETETADYKHLIIKDGEVLLETNQQKVVGKEVPFTLTFTVGDALNYPWEVFEEDNAISTSLTFNRTSKMVRFSYVDSTGMTASARLLVLKLSKSNSTEYVICNTSSEESSATITCNMSSYDEGNFIAYGYIESDITKLLNFVISTIIEIFDRYGLLLGFFIILVSGFAFIWNPTAGVIGVESAIILVNVIGLVSFSPIFIFASIAIAILALILLRS